MTWLAQFAAGTLGRPFREQVWRSWDPLFEIPGAVESGDEDPSGVLFRLQSGRAACEVLSRGKKLPSAGDPGSVVRASKYLLQSAGR